MIGRFLSALALIGLLSGPASSQYVPGLNRPLSLASSGTSVVAVPIGAPVSIASNCQNTPTTTFTFTTTGAIPAGSLSIVSFASSFTGTSAGAVASVSDGTNSYTLAERQTNGGTNVTAELWQKPNASAVGSGATITVTYSGTSNGSCGMAATVTGIQTTTPLDKIAVGPGTNTATPTVSTGTLTTANQLVLCQMTGTNAAGVTPDGTFTTIGNSTTANTNATSYFAYRIVSSTGSITCAPTQGAANSEALVAATFKGN